MGIQALKQLVIGVDLDGVLANFNAAYRTKLIEVTGRDLIPEQDCSGNTVETTPPCWYYPVDHYGYTKDEDKATWKAIVESPDFWRSIRPYPETFDFLCGLGDNEVYFITTRPGATAHSQSVEWLERLGEPTPNVIIARGSKGDIAKGIGLTHFIDDKPENCWDVYMESPDTKIFMPRTRYNQHHANSEGITCIDNILQFTEALSGGN